MKELLEQYGHFAIVATSMAVVMFALYHRKSAKLEAESNNSLQKILRETISDLKVRCVDLEKERDNYREQKHIIANDLNAATLRVEEMKSLPDLRSIVDLIASGAKEQQRAFTDLFELMRKLNDKIDRK